MDSYHLLTTQGAFLSYFGSGLEVQSHCMSPYYHRQVIQKSVQLELFDITSVSASDNLHRWRELHLHFGLSVKIFFQLNLTYCDGFISSVDHLGSFSILLWIWIGGSKSLHVSLLSPLGDLEIGPTGIFQHNILRCRT